TAHNAQVVAQTPGAATVFAVQENGDVVHIQSGLRCPAAFKNVAFWRVEIFPSAETGGDVGCDYGRSAGDGHAVSKLTIFATRSDGASLDAAFAAHEAQIAQIEDARYRGPALVVDTKNGTASPLGDFRSAEYDV